MKTEEEMINEVLGWFKSVSPESQVEFRDMEESELTRLHHSLGQSIRNEFELWDMNHNPLIVEGIDISPEHPDNKSMRIITEVWKRVQLYNTVRSSE